MTQDTVMNSVIDALRAALGPAAVLAGDAVPERNCNDYSGMLPSTPLAVVRPTDTAGVSAALRICHQHAEGRWEDPGRLVYEVARCSLLRVVEADVFGACLGQQVQRAANLLFAAVGTQFQALTHLRCVLVTD